MNEIVAAEGCTRLPPEARKTEIPYLVVSLLIGATPLEDYKGKKDVVGVQMGKRIEPFHVDDFGVAADIAKKIRGEYLSFRPLAMDSRALMPDTVMNIHRMATRMMDDYDDLRFDTKGLLMMKDGYGGSGWWRMVLPARHMKADGWHVDVTSAEVKKFEHLLEYETIYVQRVHDWDSFYTLERLAKAGRRIVYDLDDDLFRIPATNPSFHVVGRDQQQAARECMRIADAVTCTTQVMKERVVLEGIDAEKVYVIPNSLDCSDRWLPTEDTGSPDGRLRIFWQGGATHAEDWLECAEAVDNVMRKFPNVILMILGALPPIVQKLASQEHWQGRVQYLPFSDVETYYETIHHIRADVGIAPLEDTTFNQAKSPIKWLEYALIGMPTVASDMDPYSSVIEDGKTGRLVAGVDEWTEAIASYLENAEERKNTVEAARLRTKEIFDLQETTKKWTEILTG